MVNDEIITALKNAISRGESLEMAVSTAIGSGYNQREVEEAAKFVGQGAISIQRINPSEVLTTPSKKGFFSGNVSKSIQNPPLQQQKPQQQIQQSQYQQMQNPQTQKNQTMQQPDQNALFQNKPVQQQNNQAYTSQINTLPQDKQVQRPQQLPGMPQDRPFQQNIQNQQSKQIKPVQESKSKPYSPKQSYAKEIILLLLLLILIGVLIVTVFYRDQIIGFFSR